MKRALFLSLAVLTISLSAQSPEPVDSAAIAKIREHGLQKSQVMETMFWLTDRYGPRLTGSKEFEEAGDWTVNSCRTGAWRACGKSASRSGASGRSSSFTRR